MGKSHVRTVDVITAPTEEPISVAEAKTHLRIDYTDEDTLIALYIKAARRHIEEVRTGRAFITQTLEATLDYFPSVIYLPRPPLQEVLTVKYTLYEGDPASPTTLSANDYIVDTNGIPGFIVPAAGEHFPYERLYPAGAVKIQYKAGYGDADDVPEEIKQAILLLTGDFYRNRESTTGTTVKELPYAVRALTAGFCVRWA